jgi:hypothetical protein
MTSALVPVSAELHEVAGKLLDMSGPWTLFWDMHSGGRQKLDWDKILIQADEGTARAIFQNRFDRDPDNVTCSCCGEDYSVNEESSISQAIGYHLGWHCEKGQYIERQRRWHNGNPDESFRTMKDFLADPEHEHADGRVKFIFREEFTERDLRGICDAPEVDDDLIIDVTYRRIS